ncbi:retrovirus-related pol polyprotein from transposon TNT 1-94 [Tanacetum coccineum]
MAAVEVPQTLEYRGGQLNAAPVLEVENFTNWKKRFMCHIIGIEPQFENIISNGPFIPMAAGQRKPEGQWTADERKAANLDQRLKSLIMSVLPDDQMNSVINCLTAKSTWDDLILYHEGPSDVKESRVMDLKLCYNTFKFKEGESLTQTFTRYKALMNELVNDGIKLSKLEINTGFINGLPKKWLSFCQSLRNTNHVKDSELASLFGKLKYEENLIDNSPDDEEDTRSTHEYLNNLEEEYQARALLAKSKRFFKKGTQRFSSAKATDQTECHKCGKKGHFARDCWSKTSVPSYQLPFQLKLLHSSEHKLEPRRTKDFEAKYNKVKAKLAFHSSKEVSSDDNEVTEVKALMALTDEERVFVGKESDNNAERVKISIQKCISEQIPTQKKKILIINQLTEDTSSSMPKDPVFIKSLADNSKMSITGCNKPKLSGAKDFTLSNHDTGKVPSNESQRNTTDHSVVVSDSLVTDYDSTNESSVCSTPLPPLEKLTGAEHVFGPKTIKSNLKSKSTFKAETFKGIIINEPSPAPVRGNKSSSASKTNSAPAGKLKNVKIEDNLPLAIVMKELNELKLQFSKNKSFYFRNKNSQQYHSGQSESSSRSRPSRPAMPFLSCIHYGYNDHQSVDCVYYPICEICGSYDHDTHGHNRIISLIRGIKPRNPQHITNYFETCGSNVHTTSDHNDIEWFKKREALQAKKVESFKASKTESSNSLRSKTPTKRWVSKQN